MILDNARIHHAKLIQSFLEENTDRLTLIFLPPYSPELNLIEGFWRWLKSNVINNYGHKNHINKEDVNQIYGYNIHSAMKKLLKDCQKNMLAIAC